MCESIWEKTRNNIELNRSALQEVLIDGQFDALIRVSDSLIKGGVILADEVGLGKTFIALALIENLIEVGGTVGIVVPPGLLFQWKSEIKKFRDLMAKATSNLGLKSEIVKIQNFRDIIWNAHYTKVDRKIEPLVAKSSRPIALLTHNFTAPRIKINSKIEHFLLPSLYWEARVEGRSGKDSSLRLWNDWKKTAHESNGFIGICNHLVNSDISWDPQELAYLADKENRILQYDLGKDRRENVTRSFQEGVGKTIQNKLFGHAIGHLDLIIVDEAHKSKSVENSDTILGNLLANILNPLKADSVRVLGMTATPVELDVDQWQQLLKRIGKSSIEIEEKVAVIHTFGNSLSSARQHPDNVDILKALIESSQQFQKCLNDTVYRRRRYHLPRFKELTKESSYSKSSHPNRELKEVRINFLELDARWKASVLAYEGISKAVKGLKDSRILKILDKRYASGLIGKEINEASIDDKKEISSAEKAQMGRVEYWKKFLKESGENEADEDNDLNSHPRIQAGADHIDLCQEKILVFGTFTKPLRSLRNVVNFRYVLRQIDKGLPCRFSDSDNELKYLYDEYLRVKAKKKSELHLQNELAPLLEFNQFRIKIETAKREYLNLSKSINKFFHDYKISENDTEPFFEKLPGNDALRKLNDIDQFYDFLQGYIISEIIQNQALYEEYKSNDLKKTDRITNIAKEVWTNFILAHGDADELDDGPELDNKIDAIGDRISKDVILSIIKEDEMISHPSRSNFCRFMDGSMKMKGRRTLQLQFNKLNGMPKVLIAQSMVGREGLNLHEACRKVFLFHPEWNPAVVEQQIGRVDRLGSYWEKLVQEFKENKLEKFPYIEVDYLIFEGTYDQFQYERMKDRRENMAAQLFGALLPEETLEKVPEDMKEALAKAAPDFSPMKK